LIEEILCARTLDFEVTFPGPTLTLRNVPTKIFNQIVAEFRADGWRKVREYNGFDAWIDYGLIVLKRRGDLLKCEWTNWEDGSFEGSPATIESVKAKLMNLHTA
jgi:SH3-like domain-containing protein